MIKDLLDLWQRQLRLADELFAPLIQISVSTLEKHRHHDSSYKRGTLIVIADFIVTQLDQLGHDTPKHDVELLLRSTLEEEMHFLTADQKRIEAAVKRTARRLGIELPENLT